MKLLGWMHRKFRQSTGETLKELSMGQPSLDDQQYYYSKQEYCSRTWSNTQRDKHVRKSFATLEAAREEEEEEEEDPAFSELFHGFLAIGTLGSDPVIADLSTPKFSISIEHLAEKETEVTESDLRLINEELEKVLGDDGNNDSSGRNSLASAGRSSHGSTITLSGKSMEGTEGHGNGTVVCPLQSYLLGTATGMPGMMMPKKESRTSLGDLFQKTNLTGENFATNYDSEKRTEKESDKSAVHLMKKILKKKMSHASSQSSTATSGGKIDSASAAEKKLHKIRQMFHRKVHPESSVATEKTDKLPKRTKKSVLNEGGNDNANWMLPTEDITLFPQSSLSRKSTGQGTSQPALGGIDSNGNNAHWIKTDADYLVLEL